jgi:Fe-S oxidoreductase/predicted porin
MSPLVTAVLLLAALGSFVHSASRRLLPLAALRREERLEHPAERVRALLRFGLGQRRVLDPEERTAGVLHVLLFAAFLVLALRTVTLFGIGFDPAFHLPGLAPASAAGRVYLLVKDLVVLGACAGAAGFLWRRLVTRPPRLTRSWEGVLILCFILGLMLTELAFDGAERLGAARALGITSALDALAPGASLAALGLDMAGLSPAALRAIGAGAFWLHLALVAVFLNLLPFGKHFHVVTALPNVFLRALPPGSARLRTLDLEAEGTSFGAATVADLSWKDGLDVLSCTECGRCETRCPAHVTGKPLSHKTVNGALKRHLTATAPTLRAAARAKDSEARGAALAALAPLSAVVEPDTFWSCTTCGWCETACPVLIENIPRLVDLRRQQVLVEAAGPDELSRVFKNLETQGNPWGIGSNRRADWCADLDVPRASQTKDFEWLFFVGCAGAFDDRQKKVSRAIVKVLRAAGVKFAILGEEETCTGDAARRLGNEYLYQLLAQQNLETFARYGVTKVLTQCPHCLNAIRNEYPDLGGCFEVVHHTELIARLVEEGRLRPTAGAELAGEQITFHDPCYLARHNATVAAPRTALSAAGVTITELERSGRTGFCCGGGGGRMWLEEKLGTRVNRSRAEEVAATLGPSGGAVATGCPFCLTMLKDGLAEIGHEDRIRVLDVAELVAAHVEPGRSEEEPMTKKLAVVALLLAAVFPSPSRAQELDVHAYGTFLPFMDNVRARGATAPGASPASGDAALVPASAYTGASLSNRNRVTSGTSNVGFRGSLIVNDHLQVIWQVESAVSPDGDAPNVLAGRNTGVGLAGDWGRVFFGSWDTPYKVPTLFVTPLRGFETFDNFVTANPGFNVPGTTTQTGRVNGKADAAFSRRQGNSVQYWTPVFHGLSARVAYSANEGKTAAGGVTISPQVGSALVTYEHGPFGARYGYERHRDYFGLSQLGGSPGATATNASSTDQAHELVGWYALPSGTKLSAIGERLVYRAADSAPGAVNHYARRAWYALLQQRIGDHQLWGAYGQALRGDATFVGGGAASTRGLGARQWSVGYSYSVAKTADVYACYYEMRNERSSSYAVFPSPGTVAPGADTLGFGVGVLYTFDIGWTAKP